MKPVNVHKKLTPTLVIALAMNGYSLIAADATQLFFSVQPTNAVVGAALAPVAVQLADKGTNVAQSDVAISLALNKNGLGGTTNVLTDATGKAVFANLTISLAGSGDKLTAAATGLKSAASSSFNITKGGTATTLSSSTNFLVYGQINVFGLATTGTDSVNYFLAVTNTTAAANILPAALLVAAVNLTRPYATTNPVLLWVGSGFVAGESSTNSDLTGAPFLTTTAKSNSNVENYPIAISKGTLASVDYKFSFTNGVLIVVPASTAAQLSTTANPARTNQNVTFAAQVTPVATTLLPPVGVIQFKCNGTNKIGNAISVSSGLANVTVLAATLGQTNAVITAEYSDPAGNFSPSTNSLTQSIVMAVTPPVPSKLSLAPSFAGGNVTAQLAGTANQTYVIQVSTDLVNWISIATNIADAAGAISLVDSNAVAFPSRFYRAFSAP